MKITLFERWRRKGTKHGTTRRRPAQRRRLGMEALETRQLLSGNGLTGHAPHDINGDGYLNLGDVIKIVSYYNTFGSGPVASQLAVNTGHASSLSSSSTSSSGVTNPEDMDVNGDGFINLTDVIQEIQAFSNPTQLASYILVPTLGDSIATETPLNGQSIVVGTTFYIDVMVQDTRTDPNNNNQPFPYNGVAAGQVDVSYTPDASNPGAVAPTVPNVVQFDATKYPAPGSASARVNFGTPGVLTNVQGSEVPLGGTGGFTPLGAAPVLLNRIKMTATQAGVVNFTSGILHAGYVTYLASASGGTTADDALALTNDQLQFGNASVTIVTAPPVPATLGGTVYVDSNGNSVFDAGDSGLANVGVQLYDNSDNAIGAPQLTDSSGNYSFTNLQPGTYKVKEIQPSGFFETAVNVGKVDGVTTGTSSNFDTISSIVLASASTGTGYNFGVQAPVGLSGIAYVDLNGDNAFNGADTGLANVSVQLFNAQNQPVGAPHITSSNGSYSFTGLVPGTYTLVETPPTGAFSTGVNVGSINGTPTGTANGTDTIQTIALGSGAAGTGYNFALLQFATIAGTEYIDNDASNTLTNGDTPLAGVTMQLLDAGNQVIASTTTASNGTYSFQVKPGTYAIHETAPGNGLIPTASTVGTVSGSPVGVQVGVDTITTIVLASGAAGTGYNFATQSNVPPLAEVKLEATQLDGSPLPAVIPGGMKFWVYEYVTDLRQPSSDARGIQEAYTTITFDHSQFVVASPLAFEGEYQFAQRPASGTPTDLTNVGAFAGTSSLPALSLPDGTAKLLVFRVQLQAIAAGTSSIIVGQPTSTPADPLGIYLFPLPPATNSSPLLTSQIHFIGLNSLQSTQPNVLSVDAQEEATRGTVAGTTTPMNFTFHLTEPTTAPITVNYTTQIQAGDNAVGGATASTVGADYVLPNYDGQHPNVGRFVIPAGTSGDFTIPLIDVIGNPLNQADKKFHLVLTSADNNLALSPTALSSQAVIHSGVALPTISVLPASGTMGGFATFNVTLSAHSGQVVTVHYQTQATTPQSAIPGTDFEVKSGDITFNPSDVSLTKQIQVALPLDVNEVPPTFFEFVISSASNAVLPGGGTQQTVLGTILPLAASSLSGYVYFDQNLNGLRDSGETGYLGVTLKLDGTDVYGHAVHLSTTTSTSGYYSFGTLVKGAYTLTEEQPKILLQGHDNIGTQGGTSPATNTFQINLDAGVSGTDNNFGENGIDPNALWTSTFLG